MSSTVKLTTPVALAPGDIVGVNLQNAGLATLQAGVATFGQAFAAGDVPFGQGLVARMGGQDVSLQMDVKTRYADGSVKFAVLSVERPDLVAGQIETIALKAQAGAAVAPSIDLTQALQGHSFTVDITPLGGTTIQVNALQALNDALIAGKASFWQKGALTSEARVEVDLPGSQRLVFDVTAYKGGGFAVDVQFNNDQAMGPSGGRVDYEAVVRLDGAVVDRETVSQAQYQNWRETYSSTKIDGGQGLGGPSEGWLNVQHDVAYLESTGSIAQYDLTLGVAQSVLTGWSAATNAATWSQPLASNGVTRDMGATGGRPDIGFTTAANTGWLISQDARAAAYAIGQAETSGATPWNFWDGGHGTWLNTANYPRIWTDGRGGSGSAGNANSGGLAQQVAGDTGWALDVAHQPDLSFVPYLMTGDRATLDGVMAQASYNLVGIYRPNGGDVVVDGGQVRGSAWGLRQIDNAAWSAPDGSVEKAYFQAVSDTNWKWLVAQIPAWTALQGEAHGWLPGAYGYGGTLPPWQQDYFASTTLAAASRGNADALTFLNWQSNFLVGRFLQGGNGFAPHDGVAYNLAIGSSDGSVTYKTWAEIGAQTAARGGSNGSGWTQSQGDYAQLGAATLAGIYSLTGSQSAYDAYVALARDNPPFTSATIYTTDLQYAVTIPGIYSGTVNSGAISSGTIRGTSGADVVNASSGGPAIDADLGDGYDILSLGAGGNTGVVRNVERLIGSTGDDNITITAATGGSFVDLGSGADTLTLANGGQIVTVRNVETIRGGAGDDDVTLDLAASAISIDLGGGANRLALASGANTLTVSNAQTIQGNSGADTVTLGTAIASGFVDLGGGADRLVLANGANSLTVSNVETIQGGSGADTVTLGAAVNGAVVTVDLGNGADRLVLAAGGSNVLASNVETIQGGAGADVVTLLTGLSGGVIDLGGGTDRLVLANATNFLTVSNVEEVLGGTGADTVTLGAAASGAMAVLGGASGRPVLINGTYSVPVRTVETSQGGVFSAMIDLGGGNDRLTLANGTNSVRVSNVETIQGGAGADTVTLGTLLANGVVDLGGGTDRLIFANGVNTGTVSNVENVTGGTGNDSITFGAAISGAEIDLGGGIDRLTLASGTNVVRVSNVETIQGGNGADTVTLGTVMSTGLIDLGAGVDLLRLANGNNTFTARNVETIIGGTGNDNVTLGQPVNGIQVDLGGGIDRLTLADNTSNTVTVSNVEFIRGGEGSDTVTLTTAITGGAVNLGGGVDYLRLADGINTLTLSNVENLWGGTGNDTLSFATGISNGTLDTGGGMDLVRLANTDNSLTITNLERIHGGSANDRITVTGSVSARVEGGDGADQLFGGSGNDTINGGNGQDLMSGGAGIDSFVFGGMGASTALAPDRIIDFDALNEKLVFEGMLTGSFAFRGAGSFVAGQSQARYSEASSRLEVDANGDNTADLVVILQGVRLVDLSASDFIWS